jgi:hypothetical protein
MPHNTWKKDHTILPPPFSTIGLPSSFCALGLMFSLCTLRHIVILQSHSTIIFALIFTLSFCMLTSLSSLYTCSTISFMHSILHLHYACLFRHLHSTFNLLSSFCVFFFVVILSIVAFVRVMRICQHVGDWGWTNSWIFKPYSCEQ